ncbi:MAG: hypothetical protein GY830_06025 [Bacteroidetes bacterium]|nr:hypothetical protein [Bacteroidota bacterium]
MKTIWFCLGISLIIGIILLSQKSQKKLRIKSIKILSADNQDSSKYLHKVIQTNLSELNIKLINRNCNEISFKKLESILKTSKLIKKVSIYRSLTGKLYIKLIIRKPIARLLIAEQNNKIQNNQKIDLENNPKKDNLNDKSNLEIKEEKSITYKKSFYIDETGFLIPISLKYQFRVLTLIFDKFKGLNSHGRINEYDTKLLKLLLYINEDKFLNAQITHINIDKKGYIKLFTQISKQSIEFGQPEDIECKFDKFKTLYKKVLPKAGWNKYNRVNLEFDKQIICE